MDRFLKTCLPLVLDDNFLLKTDGSTQVFYLNKRILSDFFQNENCCYSEKTAVAISKFIPYVIGMNQSIEDEAAIVFAQGFYDGLGFKNSNDEDVFLRAFKQGLVAINMEGYSQRTIPVLKKPPMSATQIKKRHEGRAEVEYAIRLVPKIDFQENGYLGKKERKYVLVGDYEEQQGRTLKEILKNFMFGTFEDPNNYDIEWLAIVFKIGILGVNKFDLKPATWKSVFRILSDRRRYGCFEMSEEERKKFGTPPYDYYSNDQLYWRDRLCINQRISNLIPCLGIQKTCYPLLGLTDAPSRIFFVKNFLLSTLNGCTIQDLGRLEDKNVLE